MKKYLSLLVWILLLGLLSACGASTDTEPIQPGDKIGDFTITTAEPDEATFGWDGDCEETAKIEGDDTLRYTCTVSTEKKFNPGSAAYALGTGKTLDEVWEGFKYELKIDGRPVDLEAFGVVEMMRSTVGLMRAYNVVIVTDKPGEIQIDDVTTMPGEDPIKSSAVITFIVP